jgi:hypothetical protein
MDLVEAISNGIDSFPQEMLTLDTPCVAELRWRNKNSRTSHTPKTSARLSHSKSHSSCRRLTKTANPGDSASEISFPSPIDDASLPASYIERTPDNRKVDLRPLRTIFTQTDDWWRSLLYAHLVAYNHITALQAPPLSNDLSVNLPPQSPKRRKRIPRDSIFGPPPAPLHLKPSASTIVAQNLAEVEEALASCITCIANFMAGHSDSLYGEDFGVSCASKSLSDQILVRSLAEVVKGCESS